MRWFVLSPSGALAQSRRVMQHPLTDMAEAHRDVVTSHHFVNAEHNERAYGGCAWPWARTSWMPPCGALARAVWACAGYDTCAVCDMCRPATGRAHHGAVLLLQRRHHPAEREHGHGVPELSIRVRALPQECALAATPCPRLVRVLSVANQPASVRAACVNPPPPPPPRLASRHSSRRVASTRRWARTRR